MAELLEQAWGLMPHLLAAPGDDLAWGRFLKALGAELSAGACLLLSTRPRRDRPGTLIAHGVDLGRRSVAEVAEPAPEKPLAIDRLAPGSVFAIPARADYIATRPFFRERLAGQGVRPGPGLGIVLDRHEKYASSSLVVLPKRRSWRPTASDRALLEQIAPSLVQARAVDARIWHRAHDSEALLAIFDRLVLGVILIDETGRVSYANRSAAELLGQPSGLADPATLAKRKDPRTEALRHFIGTERLTSRGAHVFSDPKDDRPLQLFSTPLSWPAPEREARARFVRALFIGDPSRTAGEPADILRELYGLTQAESRLAILLATGYSVAEAARHLGVAVNTARTQLKTVFSKTGTNRQASLVRLFVGGPGQLRGAAARRG